MPRGISQNQLQFSWPNSWFPTYAHCAASIPSIELRVFPIFSPVITLHCRLHSFRFVHSIARFVSSLIVLFQMAIARFLSQPISLLHSTGSSPRFFEQITHRQYQSMLFFSCFKLLPRNVHCRPNTLSLCPCYSHRIDGKTSLCFMTTLKRTFRNQCPFDHPLSWPTDTPLMDTSNILDRHSLQQSATG